jgi:DNA-binding NarL/FixJ family response regulator
MFTKVLIAEDYDSYNVVVTEALRSLGIAETISAPYCDEALLKLRRALTDELPYQLLVSDLSFKPDHRVANLKSGEELIAAAKKIQPSLKVIVYSIEERPHPIRSLFERHDINGYVVKEGRDNLLELKKAIAAVYTGDRYLSRNISHMLKDTVLPEIDDYDIELINLLAQGLLQEQIAAQFKSNRLSPNSTSSIEKRINRLKTYLRAQNNVHLVAIAKDMGLV